MTWPRLLARLVIAAVTGLAPTVARADRPLPFVLDLERGDNAHPLSIAPSSDGSIAFTLVRTGGAADSPDRISLWLTEFRDAKGSPLPVTLSSADPATTAGATAELTIPAAQTIYRLALHADRPSPARSFTGRLILTAPGFVPKVWTLALDWPTAQDTPGKIGALHALGMTAKASSELESKIGSDAIDPSNVEAWRALLRTPWGYLVRAQQLGDGYLTPLLAGLAKAGAAVVVVILVVVGLVRVFRRRRANVLHLGKFDGSVPAIPWSTLLPAGIESHISRMGQANQLTDSYVISGPVQSLSLPADVSFVAKEGTSIVRFLEWLLPAHGFELKGNLLFDQAKSVGLSLCLVEEPGQRIVASEVIWLKDVWPQAADSPEKLAVLDGLRLADAAAIWTYWQLHAQVCGPIDDGLALRRAFGTDRWSVSARPTTSGRAT